MPPQLRALWLVLPLFLQTPAMGCQLIVPLGLPAIPVEKRDNSQGDAAIGKELFFDQRLSADGTISCGTCHRPERDFSDGRALGVGIGGKTGTRNAPSLLNVAYATTLFWDGRVTSLESQASRPLLNLFEHGLASEAVLVEKINADPNYRRQLANASHTSSVTVDSISSALASYERTLLAGNSPFDRYQYGGDHRAMSDSAIRGLELFRGRAGCAACHTIGEDSALFTDHNFHASPTGLPDSVNLHLVELTQRVIAARQSGNTSELNSLIVSDPAVAALGRFVVTMNPADIGLFKTPSLRNVTETAPYLHDGHLEKLEDVVDAELYSRGDAVRYPIVANATDKADLIEFLHALRSP